jgi:hypothetical protein
MRTTLFLSTALAATVAATLSTSAHADDLVHGRHVGGLEARAEGSRIGFNTDIWPAADFVVAAMGITGQFEVAPHFLLDLDIPWAAGNYGGGLAGRNTGASFGNITFGGHGVFKIGHEAAINAGLTLSVPTRYNFDTAGDAYVTVALLSSATRGFYDLQRLFPGVLFIRFPLGAEFRFARLVHFRAELTPAILIPVAERSKHDPQVTLEHADEIEVRAPFGLGGGLRFQLVAALSNFGSTAGSSGFVLGPGDRVQTGLEPFIQYEPRGAGIYARLGTLLALDSALGPAADRDKLATIRISVGGKF